MTEGAMPMTEQPFPLAGFRVIDYSHFLAGPYLSRCLAAMGAEVIKVERPTTGDPGRAHPYFKDGQSGYFLQQNMGKQGLCVIDAMLRDGVLYAEEAVGGLAAA
jgi:crotonobetainyl-CoA:carnitine CoA-transferase CaiB-like acyl-CoA transferase